LEKESVIGWDYPRGRLAGPLDRRRIGLRLFTVPQVLLYLIVSSLSGRSTNVSPRAMSAGRSGGGRLSGGRCNWSRTGLERLGLPCRAHRPASIVSAITRPHNNPSPMSVRITAARWSGSSFSRTVCCERSARRAHRCGKTTTATPLAEGDHRFWR